ncbi:MAG TPA: CRISPR-associated protein [Gammaproteobacteria bacterium]|nr:CRISPR-associated protein [Gammaproteobacteria bacterium]
MKGIEKRAVGLLVLEVINSNPNGDPDRESDPRQRLDGRGEISPVSFKRKLRDLVENKEGPVWLELAKELALNPEEFDILESRGRDRSEINKLTEQEFIKRYWDGRVFGNTFLESGGTLPIKTGAVQFAMGLSVAPIQIERMTNTNKAGVQEGKDRGMAPLAYRVVQHGVYYMPFFVNPSAAQKSGCTKKDIELMLRLIPYAYSHTASYIRPQVELRHAWYAEHKSALGSFSDQAFIEALMPQKKENPDKPSNCWGDYSVPNDLPESLKYKTEKFIDLVEGIQ